MGTCCLSQREREREILGELLVVRLSFMCMVMQTDVIKSRLERSTDSGLTFGIAFDVAAFRSLTNTRIGF
jgi:hypothetical protein